MTGRELGFLLLGSHLGDPGRKPLTSVRLASLSRKMQTAPMPPPAGEVSISFLKSIGCDDRLAEQILFLLSQQGTARAYVESAHRRGLACITRRSPGYPRALIAALGDHAPAVLWAWGDKSIMADPCISLVGSRDADEESLAFASQLGIAAAAQDFTLVSGGARGIDKAGQAACLEAGGKVISVLPDSFHDKEPPREKLLYLWEDSFDLHFTAQRALSRNHVIHSLGQCAFVAQCGYSGGTWNGTIANLRRGCTPVYAFRGCKALALLQDMGAIPVDFSSLEDLQRLARPEQTSLFE